MENSKLYAAYFKKMRKEKDLKLEAVASMTNYSVSYLSELERGKKTLSQNDWNSLFQSLDIPIYDNNFYENHVHLFKNFIDYIVYADEDNYKKLANNILLSEEALCNSPLFLAYYCNIFYYFTSIKNTKEAGHYLKELQKYTAYFSPEELYFFEIFLALYYIYNNENGKSLKIFENFSNSNLIIRGATSIMYYFYAYSLLNKYNYFEAYHYIKLAQNTFLTENNIIRYAAALLMEANIFTEQKFFSKANEIYTNILSLNIKSKSPQLYYVCSVNYAYCLTMQKRYEEALKIDVFVDNEQSYYSSFILTKTLCLYHLNHSECIKYIDSLDESLIETEFIKAYLKIMHLLIENPLSKEFEQLLKTSLRKHESELDNNIKELLLNYLLNYYRETKNIKKQIIVLEALLQLSR